MYLLGLDIGTTKIAGVLLQKGKVAEVISVISAANEADILTVHQWEKLQEPQKILQTCYSILAQLKDCARKHAQSLERRNTEGSGRIACIGISAQMHGFLYLGAQGEALSPLYTWQDQRAAVPLEHRASPASCQAETSLERIATQTGQDISAGYALASHYYNCQQQLQPAVPYKLVSIGGYLAMKLCGGTNPCIDPSEGASFGLYDLNSQDFLRRDIHKLWGATDFLPTAVPFYHQVGFDADGIPLFQSLGDNQASFFGAMCGRKEKVLLNLGTGGQLSILLDALPAKCRGLEIRPYPPGVQGHRHLLVGSTLAGGKSFALLADFLGDVLRFFGKGMTRAEIYATIDRYAAQEAELPVQPLRVKPYFGGTRLDPAARGAIENLCAENLSARHLLHGFAEAIVLELKNMLLDNQLKSSIPLQAIVGSGNGIRSNPLIRHTITRLFDCRLHVCEHREEAARGAALYAHRALGISIANGA